MQNFGRENFDDSISIRQNSSDFSPVKVLRYTVLGPNSYPVASYVPVSEWLMAKVGYKHVEIAAAGLQGKRQITGVLLHFPFMI